MFISNCIILRWRKLFSFWKPGFRTKKIAKEANWQTNTVPVLVLELNIKLSVKFSAQI